MTRQEANTKLLNILSSIIKQYPDYRFGQALYNLGLVHRKQGLIVDPFFEEPVDTLSRISHTDLPAEPTLSCNFNVAVRFMADHNYKFTSPDFPDTVFSFTDGNYVMSTTSEAEGYTMRHTVPTPLSVKLLNATFIKYDNTNAITTTTSSSN